MSRNWAYWRPDGYYKAKYGQNLGIYYHANFNFHSPKTLAFKVLKFLAEVKYPTPRYQVVNEVWGSERLNARCVKMVYGGLKDKFSSNKELGDWNSEVFKIARHLGFLTYTSSGRHKGGWIATPKGKALVRDISNS